LLWLVTSPVLAVDIQGILPIAFDQPQVYGVLQPAGGGSPYAGEDIFGNPSFTISAFLDTGSSGIVIDPRTQTALGLPTAAGVTFSDVAIGGNTNFNVSVPLDLRIASSTAVDLDHLATLPSVYNQPFNSVRMQVGPTNISPDPASDALDIFGMPVMKGKTVVMDPKPLNVENFEDLDFMHTFIYDPGTPFHPSTQSTNPGIPSTSHHVKLSYGNFDKFTTTTPGTAEGPTQHHNPFIGPDPLNQLSDTPVADNTPGVRVAFGGHQTTGSFLLDTGAVTSFISSKLAGELNVRYAADTIGTDEPILEFSDQPGTHVPDQFIFPIQGIGGTATLAGFFLDHLIVETQEGGTGDHPNNLRYVRAPVLITDIELVDPLTLEVLTLDGVFGMNYMVASAFVLPDLSAVETAIGPYNWITFDEPNGILGLDLGIQVPEPGSIVLAAMGLLALAGYAWRHRGRVSGRQAPIE
jgi:hypothetical protein